MHLLVLSSVQLFSELDLDRHIVSTAAAHWCIEADPEQLDSDTEEHWSRTSSEDTATAPVCNPPFPHTGAGLDLELSFSTPT